MREEVRRHLPCRVRARRPLPRHDVVRRPRQSPDLVEDQSNTVTITWTLPSAAGVVGDDVEGPAGPGAGRMVVADRRTDRGAVPVGRRRSRRRRWASAMYSVTRLLDVADEDRDRVLAAVRSGAEATHAHHRLVEPTLPGSRNGGDVLVHLRFDSREPMALGCRRFRRLLCRTPRSPESTEPLTRAPRRATAAARAPCIAPCCCGYCPIPTPAPSHASKTSCPRCRATYRPSGRGS